MRENSSSSPRQSCLKCAKTDESSRDRDDNPRHKSCLQNENKKAKKKKKMPKFMKEKKLAFRNIEEYLFPVHQNLIQDYHRSIAITRCCQTI
jgi:hypothetical protein